MGLWSRFAKSATPNMPTIDESLDRLAVLGQIQRENTQWVMDAIAKQRDDARTALAARDAEVARLREALENVTYVHYPDGTKECRWCGSGNGEHEACEIVRYLAVLADPTKADG